MILLQQSLTFLHQLVVLARLLIECRYLFFKQALKELYLFFKLSFLPFQLAAFLRVQPPQFFLLPSLLLQGQLQGRQLLANTAVF